MEANLAFRDGMTICLMSEFLSYTEADTGNDKQDCELKAFYRLAARLKKACPALKIMLLLDGLYAKGPVAEVCRQNKWQFMIVFKDDALPSVMREFEALATLEIKNRYKVRDAINMGGLTGNFTIRYILIARGLTFLLFKGSR